MAVTGVTKIPEITSNQELVKEQELSTKPQPAHTKTAEPAASSVDSFTPSPQINSTQPVTHDSELFNAPAATPHAPIPPTRAISNAPPVTTQSQLESLNSALVSLGLTNDDIQTIDRIASVSKVFNPTVYTDLVQQFKAQAAQQAAAPSETKPSGEEKPE